MNLQHCRNNFDNFFVTATYRGLLYVCTCIYILLFWQMNTLEACKCCYLMHHRRTYRLAGEAVQSDSWQSGYNYYKSSSADLNGDMIIHEAR